MARRGLTEGVSLSVNVFAAAKTLNRSSSDALIWRSLFPISAHPNGRQSACLSGQGQPRASRRPSAEAVEAGEQLRGGWLRRFGA